MARIPCPDCGGFGRIAYTIPGVPPELCVRSSPCERCWPRDENGKKKFWADGTEGTIEVEDAMHYTISMSDFLTGMAEHAGEGQSNFESLVETLAREKRVMTITQDDKPVAVIISHEDYERLMQAFVMDTIHDAFPGVREVDG